MEEFCTRFEKVEPEEAGLDGKKIREALDLLPEGLSGGEFTACTYLIVRHGKEAACGAMGHMGGGEGTPARPDSIFDLASVTKPASTAVSFLKLANMGLLSLDMPVQDVLPEAERFRGITLAHLATHTSGLPGWRDLYSRGQSREEAVKLLFSTKPIAKPGERYQYSCLGYITLGLAVERVSGLRLDEFAARNIYRPLGLADTGYNPPIEKAGRIVRTNEPPFSRRTAPNQVQDGNALAMEGASGNAGLFSTAPDLAVIAQMLLSGGELGGVRVLEEKSVGLMFKSAVAPALGRQSIGFFMPPHSMLPCGEGWSLKCAGHTGFSGTCFVADPELDMAAILLTNRQLDRGEDSPFFARRRKFYTLLAAAAA